MLMKETVMSDYAEKIKDAIDRENLDMIKEMVTEDTDLEENLDTHFSDGRFTILHYATRHQKQKIVKFLLREKKMNPDIRDGTGVVPLYDLVRGKETDSVIPCFELFKEADANLNVMTENSWRMSLLEAGVFSKNLTMINALLEAGANPKPDTVKINGKSGNLLHLAVSEYCHPFGNDEQEKCIRIIDILASYMGSGSINEKIDEKYTPLDIATIELEKTFVNGQQDPNDDYYKHIKQIISYLIEKGGTTHRDKLPPIPLKEQVTLNKKMNEEEIDLLKNYIYSLALIVNALGMLIREKREGGGMHEEYRRVAAYSSKEMHKTIEKINASSASHTRNMGHEIFNARQALLAMENMMIPNHAVTDLDEKALRDVQGDLHGIQSNLNVYDHTYC